MTMDAAISIVPANEASWDDLQAVLGARGDPSKCQCQRYKMRPRESWRSVGVAELASRLREQTNCGHAGSGTTSGLVAYLDGEPVGWCAVEPRSAYRRLRCDCRVPWVGRADDKTDDSVWAVTCFVTRAGFRRRGVSRALARAAVDFARERGARAIEGYPMITQPGQEITWGELHVGSQSIFAGAGFAKVSRPTSRRVVMRIDLQSWPTRWWRTATTSSPGCSTSSTRSTKPPTRRGSSGPPPPHLESRRKPGL
jgi:GNAT superfamily N-acetyltransferase